MAKHPRIAVSLKVMVGQPVVKGTRLTVAFILELLAQGLSEKQILESYPGLTASDIKACLRYAQDRIESERVYPLAA